MIIKLSGVTLLTKCEYLKNLDLISVEHPWFWLRDASTEQTDLVAAVYYGDIIDYYEVDYDFSVIPVLVLLDESISIGTKIIYAGEAFTVLRDGIALCDKVVIKMPFNTDWHSKNANEYRFSDVKGWLDAWFRKNGNVAVQY